MTQNLHRACASAALAAFALIGAFTTSAQAQPATTDYPSKPLTIVVPFGAGSGTDQ